MPPQNCIFTLNFWNEGSILESTPSFCRYLGALTLRNKRNLQDLWAEFQRELLSLRCPDVMIPEALSAIRIAARIALVGTLEDTSGVEPGRAGYAYGGV